MTVKELITALEALEPDERVHIEVGGACYELKTISVVVQSDVWVPNTIVASVEEIVSEDEAS